MSPGSWEIIIVDNNIRPLVEQPLSKSNAFVIHEEKPGSYAARSAGARLAKAEILAFTDADCIPDKDWLAKGLKTIRNAKHLEAIGGAIEIRPVLPKQARTC